MRISLRATRRRMLLVPDYHLGNRIVVADRHMVAVVSPARAGGYIVVADSPRTARRIEKVLVKD